MGPVDIAPMLADVAELYEPLVEEAGGAITVDVQGDCRVTGDSQLLAQVVSNLLDNALKYGAVADGPPLHIAVAAGRTGDMVEISVADNGPGIPEDQRARALERFVRLDTSRTRPGSGLGLSLAVGVARLHGGEFRLEDNAPGLRAVLVLPASNS
jgi:signal transduction histidine kinase